jgi:hypothetical protein
MSGYNPFSILEQVTSGFRVSENGELARIPSPTFPISGILKTGIHPNF